MSLTTGFYILTVYNTFMSMVVFSIIVSPFRDVALLINGKMGTHDVNIPTLIISWNWMAQMGVWYTLNLHRMCKNEDENFKFWQIDNSSFSTNWVKHLACIIVFSIPFVVFISRMDTTIPHLLIRYYLVPLILMYMILCIWQIYVKESENPPSYSKIHMSVIFWPLYATGLVILFLIRNLMGQKSDITLNTTTSFICVGITFAFYAMDAITQITINKDDEEITYIDVDENENDIRVKVQLELPRGKILFVFVIATMICTQMISSSFVQFVDIENSSNIYFVVDTALQILILLGISEIVPDSTDQKILR
jgi:hypothetical protein